MRIEYIEPSDKTKKGSFSIYAENADEKKMLQEFVNANRNEWKPWLLSYGGTLCSNGIEWFRFGWMENKEFSNALERRRETVKRLIESVWWGWVDHLERRVYSDFSIPSHVIDEFQKNSAKYKEKLFSILDWIK